MKGQVVSIITINYNQAAVTEQLLVSLRSTTYVHKEIIVVDNASIDRSIEDLPSKFPEAQFIFSDKNLGFAGGNNLGIRKASGEYVLLLNNDTEVSPDFIEPLMARLLDPKIGAVSPKIKYFNSNIIQYAGSGAVSPYSGRSFRDGFKEQDNGQFDLPSKTDLAHGAAMMVTREVISKVGLLPELFFLYYEEVDWCESIKRAGFEIWYEPKSVVYHKESMSIGTESTVKTYYLMRNRIVYLRRNTYGMQRISWILFYIILTLPKHTLKYLFGLQFAHLKAYFKAIWWNLRNEIPSVQKH